MVEDRAHILHFGCNTLVSFDGDHWTSDAANGTYAIRGLALAPDGRIWACGVDQMGWYERRASNHWAFHSLLSHLPSGTRSIGEMWTAFATDQGALFVSADKLYFWDGRGFQIQGLPGARRLCAFKVGSGIYIDHVPTGLFRVDQQQLKLVIPASALGSAAVLWMEADRGGWLLATSRGLSRFAGGRLEAIYPEASAYVRANGLTSAVRLDDGRLALGTLRAGILVLRRDGSIERTITSATGLVTDEILSLGLDHERGLWATSSAALMRISIASPVSIFDGSSGLALPCESIAASPNGLALATGTTVILLNEASGSLNTVPQLQRHVWSLFNVPQGLMVSGTYGLDFMGVDGVKSIYRSTQDAFAIAQSRRENIELISIGRSIVQFDLTTGAAHVIASDFPDIATSIAEDRSGVIWAGTTTAGLLKIERNRSAAVVPRAALPGASSGEPNDASVVGSPDGAVFVFAARSGWMLDIGNQRFERVDGFPALRVSGSAWSSDHQSLWTVQSGDGTLGAIVGRVKIQGSRASWLPQYVEGTWRIGTPTCLYSNREAGNEVLWIGGTVGILRAAVTPETAAVMPPKPLMSILNRASSGQGSYETVDGPITYARSDILLDVAVTSYASRPSIHCETRIEGIDGDWVPLDVTGARKLVAVRDGRYTVHARATLGAASEETVASFRVLPPWWRQWQFEAALIMALAGIGYATIRIRLRQSRERAVALQALVKLRTKELENATAAKAEFVANVSHDIRNPLNGILGITYALEDSQPTPQQSQLIRALRHSASFLNSLVGNVLDLSEIEAGKALVSPIRYSPRALLEDVVAVMEPEAMLVGSEMKIEEESGIPPAVIGDSSRLQQILVNYTANAIKHAGGPITLSVGFAASGTGEIEYSVRDRGPGLSDAERSLLFSRYQRFRKGMGTATKGNGLGLSVCKSMAELLGGTVGVESELGKGARFFVRVTATVPSSFVGPRFLPRVEAKRVLLVEDSDYCAWAISAVCARVGVRVDYRAKSVAEATRAYENGCFDLILLDQGLPDGDGADVCRKVRALKRRNPPVRIIAVTASTTAEERARCLEAGMDGFVGKPVTVDKIRSALFPEFHEFEPPGGSMDRGAAYEDLDDSLIHYISDGTDAGYIRELRRYLDLLAHEKSALTMAAAENDPAAVSKIAHRIRAHAEFVGARRLAELAGVLEHRGNGEPLENESCAVQAVEESIAKLVRAINSLLARSLAD